MIRITPSVARFAKRYYTQALSRNDYYAAGGSSGATWQGRGAQSLGLANIAVTPEVFAALAENRHPVTGDRLTPRDRHDRLSGWDFTMSVPKSLSAVHALAGDGRLSAALLEAVRETMAQIESHVMTRVRRAGLQENRTTANILWTPFLHTTSRPIDGVPDPHLHVHAFMFNVTFDETEQRYKAAKIRSIKQQAPMFEAAFLSRLAAKCRALGYGIVRRGKGWELAGISESTIRKFSRRTAEIESLAARYNIHDPEIKALLGARTRRRKGEQLSPDQVSVRWRSRLSPSEQLELTRAKDHDGLSPQSMSPESAISFAIAHHLERNSVVAIYRVLETALRHAPGQFSPEEAAETLLRGTNIRRVVRDEQVFLTTEEVVQEEQAVTLFARRGVDACDPLDGGTPWVIQETRLNRGQKAAVQHVLTSRSRVLLIRGGAGTGKTTLMRETAAALNTRGHRVVILAPTADASRGVLRNEGFTDADTIERFLGDTLHQVRAAGGVIWIDEAGLVGTRTLARVFHLAERLRARVVLSGDVRQHAPQERGDALRLLIREAGLLPAEVLTVVRQRERYKAVVEAMSTGTTAAAIAQLESMGSVIEADSTCRHALLARDYVETILAAKSCLVISPTHHEGEQVTRAIREEMKRRDLLGSVDREVKRLRDLRLTVAERSDVWSYAPGQVVQFHGAVTEDGIAWKPGDKAIVTGHDLWGGVLVESPDGKSPRRLPLNRSANFKLYAEEAIALASGDLIRITRNGWTRNRHERLNNGSIVELRGFTREGHLVLSDGRIIDRTFGHLAHGFCRTSHAAQGATVDVVLISQGSGSLAAASREQLYVSVSRGREQVRIYTDDRQSIWDAAERVSERLSATELLAGRATITPNMKHAIGMQRLRLHERATRSQPRARPIARMSHAR